MAAFKGGGQYYRYRRPTQVASQSNDLERGIAAGQMVGKLFGQVGDIYKGIKANQVANDLMTKQAISAQPGAGVTQDLGKLPDDGSALDNSALNTPQDPDPDPGVDLNRAIAGARLSNAAGPGDFTLPDVTTPVPGDPTGTVGGLLHTGGVDEMKARQAAQKDQLDTAIKQAQLANSLAKLHGTDSYAKRATAAPQGVTVGGGSSSRWLEGDQGDGAQKGGSGGGSRSGKPAPYQAGSVDAENDDSADNMGYVAADFDSAMGGQKGTYAKFLANLPNLAPDANGNYSIMNKDGTAPLATVPAGDAPYWVQRTNAARRAQGLTPMQVPGVPMGQPANPASTDPPGKTAGNPIILQSKLQARSLPYGTYVKDPKTGQTYTIDRPQAQ